MLNSKNTAEDQEYVVALRDYLDTKLKKSHHNTTWGSIKHTNLNRKRLSWQIFRQKLITPSQSTTYS